MISVVIITKNAASKVRTALESVEWADEVLVLDGGSTDKTVQIAKRHGARVGRQTGRNYSEWRNQGVKEAKSDWVFFVDYDEVVSPELREEVLNVVAGAPSVGLPGSRHPSLYVAYAMPRRNIVFGKELKHGGWYPDYVLRLIKKSTFITYEGELHEQPKVEGEVGYLKNALVHYKEDNLSDMVAKTNAWSEVEAKLLYKAGHPQMTWWRFWRIMVTEVFDRLILKRGFLDGGEGIIYCLYQGWSKFLTYAKLWELQNTRKS